MFPKSCTEHRVESKLKHQNSFSGIFDRAERKAKTTGDRKAERTTIGKVNCNIIWCIKS